jgi:transposase InsO family protein
MKAGDKFQQPSRRITELWQTDFTYFKIAVWGWYYLSTVLDDYSRFIVGCRLCMTMSANDVSDTLDDALAFTELNQVKVQHHTRLPPTNARKDRVLASFDEKSNLAQSLLFTERARRAALSLRELLQS